MCFNFLYGKVDEKNRERERYLTAINWPHVAPPCLFVSLSISGMGRGPGDRGELHEGIASAAVCVAACQALPSFLYLPDPGLLVGRMGGEIKD